MLKNEIIHILNYENLANLFLILGISFHFGHFWEKTIGCKKKIQTATLQTVQGCFVYKQTNQYPTTPLREKERVDMRNIPKHTCIFIHTMISFMNFPHQWQQNVNKKYPKTINIGLSISLAHFLRHRPHTHQMIFFLNHHRNLSDIFRASAAASFCVLHFCTLCGCVCMFVCVSFGFLGGSIEFNVWKFSHKNANYLIFETGQQWIGPFTWFLGSHFRWVLIARFCTLLQHFSCFNWKYSQHNTFALLLLPTQNFLYTENFFLRFVSECNKFSDFLTLYSRFPRSHIHHPRATICAKHIRLNCLL